MKQITVRGVPEDLAKALDKERQRRGTSLNQAVLDLLRQGVGIGSAPYDNGLGRFSGTWKKDELKAFNKTLTMFEQIDEELWS